jgi:hypothetical protein
MQQKKDVHELHELTKIAIEDKIPKIQIHNMFHLIKFGLFNHWSKEKLLEEIKKYSDRETITLSPLEIVFESG